MEPINPICSRCKHSRDVHFGCKAFPEGIPAEILRFNKHDNPLKGQGNNLVFTPIKGK
jgi:hypothetical protein